MERRKSWCNLFLRGVKQKPKTVELNEILQISVFIASFNDCVNHATR